MVQVGQGGKELSSTAHLEPNDDSSFSAVLDLEHFNDGTGSSLDLVDDGLVDIKRVVAGFLEERCVRD